MLVLLIALLPLSMAPSPKPKPARSNSAPSKLNTGANPHYGKAPPPRTMSAPKLKTPAAASKPAASNYQKMPTGPARPQLTRQPAQRNLPTTGATSGRPKTSYSKFKPLEGAPKKTEGKPAAGNPQQKLTRQPAQKNLSTTGAASGRPKTSYSKFKPLEGAQAPK